MYPISSAPGMECFWKLLFSEVSLGSLVLTKDRVFPLTFTVLIECVLGGGFLYLLATTNGCKSSSVSLRWILYIISVRLAWEISFLAMAFSKRSFSGTNSCFFDTVSSSMSFSGRGFSNGIFFGPTTNSFALGLIPFKSSG